MSLFCIKLWGQEPGEQISRTMKTMQPWLLPGRLTLPGPSSRWLWQLSCPDSLSLLSSPPWWEELPYPQLRGCSGTSQRGCNLSGISLDQSHAH